MKRADAPLAQVDGCREMAAFSADIAELYGRDANFVLIITWDAPDGLSYTVAHRNLPAAALPPLMHEFQLGVNEQRGIKAEVR